MPEDRVQSPHLERLRRICLALPDTSETETWGKPHFRVGDKIFAGFGIEDGQPLMGCKLTMDHAAEAIQQPGVTKAKYVGHKGWVSINLAVVEEWKWIEQCLEESYRLIAPKKSLRKLAEP